MGSDRQQQIAAILGASPGVCAAYLFGSTARGTARTDSDVDVAVLFDVTPPPTLDSARFSLAGELEATIGRPVDLIVLNDAPADLRIRVLREGRLLVERDGPARIAFEVQTRNEAFDLEPMLARYRASRERRP